MAVCALSKAFRRLNIFKKEIASLHYSTQQTKLPVNVTPILLQIEKPLPEVSENCFTFTPRSINISFDIPRSGLPLSKIIECPILPNVQIDEPRKYEIEKSDIVPNKVIEIPTNTNIIEKRAERLIVIRRKKMKKHKRKKFLKKMKFVIQKRKLRKKLLKEKIFEAELQGILQEAEKFDPKQYVTERINLLTRERLPNKWRGEVLPEAMIRQFIKEKEEKLAHKRRLATYRLKLD